MFKVKKFTLLVLICTMLAACSSEHEISTTVATSQKEISNKVTSTAISAELNGNINNIIEDQLVNLIQQLLQTPESFSGGTLLIDNIRDKTDQYPDLPQKFDKNLIELLKVNSHFNIIPVTKITQSVKSLGLENDIVTNDREKAIAVARQLQTQYILCTSIAQTSSNIVLTMQLLSVKSGEIIWQQARNIAIPLTQSSQTTQ